MCGICGIVSQNSRPIEQPLLQEMNAALFHRGPDGEGYYCKQGVGFAMRRLAIIDLQTGKQPIANENETIHVVMNGEIYNYQSLREQLIQCGHELHTQSDTECLVHLYEDYGDKLLEHLRGMFAFALWDESKQRLLIARDRMGKKPLYYAQHNGMLLFSSELPSLCLALRKQGFAFNISLPAIDLYLALQYIPEPYTPYQNVYKLPAAHKLILQRNVPAKLQPESYWDLSFLPKWTASEEELAEEMRHRLKEAVKLRMISDVPLGAHLSGGFDSSIIVALMADLSSQPVKTYSVGFHESSFSELPYARAVAERYATAHHEFILAYGDVPETITQIVQHIGEPLADPSLIPLYHLSRMTREHVTVALNGDGGDDVLGGYQRYWLDAYANAYMRFPKVFTQRFVPSLVRYLPDKTNQPVGKSLINGLKRLRYLPFVDSRASIIRWGSYFSPSMLWQPHFAHNLGVSMLKERFEQAPAKSFLDRTLYTDLKTYLPGDLLVKADRMTMAHSLEGRSPFLDHEFVLWALRLPEHLKVGANSGKVLLRKAFADVLPPLVRKRGKQGFGIPISAWLRGAWGDWARETLTTNRTLMGEWFNPHDIESLLIEHQLGREDHGKRLYALLVLSIWLEQTHGG